MSTAVQHTFSGGEIAPVLWSRVDHQKYASGLKTNRNAIITRSGAWMNRAGTEFCFEVKDPTNLHRLVEFEFSLTQTYMLVFGDRYVQFIKNGNPVLETATTITGISNANPGVVTVANSYNEGDWVYVSGIVGAAGKYLNNRFLFIHSPSGTNTQLKYVDGTVVDTTAFGTYTSGGTIQRVYTVTTPYLNTDLASLKYDQSGDVITLVCAGKYQQATLSRTSDTNWTFAYLNMTPSVSMPFEFLITGNGSGGSGGGGSAGLTSVGFNPNSLFGGKFSGFPGRGTSVGTTINQSNDGVYKVTTVNLSTGEESFPGYTDTTVSLATITGYTLANPCVLTLSFAGGYTGYTPKDGDQWAIRGTSSQLDKKVYTISVIDATHVSLNGIDSTNYTAYSGTGFLLATALAAPTSAIPSVAHPTTLAWYYDGPFVSYPIGYNVYASLGGVFGFIGAAGGNQQNLNAATFKDTGIVPDLSKQPPSYIQVLDSANNFPSVCCYYQQRHCFAASINQPESFWGSQTNLFTNFTVNQPVQDSDAVFFQLPSTKVQIQNMLDIGNLVIFTESDERVVLGNNSGGQYGTLTPSAINVVPQSFWGSSSIRPIAVDGTAIFVQRTGNIIRDLKYNFEEDKYKGNDLTVFATHLFEPNTILDMAYQKAPNSILWVVLNNGKLLNCTINREQQILAWGENDTNGTFLNVNVIPENNYYSVYTLVSRVVSDENGAASTHLYVERFQNRIVEVSDITESIFMDCAGTYDGTNSNTAITVALSTAGGWTKSNLLTLTATGGTPFGNVVTGQEIHITDANGQVLRFKISNVTSSSVLTGYSDSDVWSALQGTSTSSWAIASNVISGLWFLNGVRVSVLGDGYVVASAKNPAYPAITVTNGQITLSKCYSRVQVGRYYYSDFKTLDLDVVGYSVFMGQTASDKWKNISELTVNFVQSRGGFFGSATPETESANPGLDPLFKLYEIKELNQTASMNLPPPLVTDTLKLTIQGGWDVHGNVFLRQVDPLPICVSAVAYAGNLPLRQPG